MEKKFIKTNKRTYTYYSFNNSSKNLLIWLADQNEITMFEQIYNKVCKDKNISMIVLQVDNWNDDLTPWQGKPIFGKIGFNGKGEEFLNLLVSDFINNLSLSKDTTYYLGGYSLAGLFCLWASTKTSFFRGYVACSPSLWYEGMIEYIFNNKILTEYIYLSLGDKEKMTKNKIMASVEDKVKEAAAFYQLHLEDNCIYEINNGDHFKNIDLRIEKGITWLVNKLY